MAVVHQVVPGIRKAAIVMLLVGEELSSEVFKHLSEDEIESLSKEMAALGPVPMHLGEKILDALSRSAGVEA